MERGLGEGDRAGIAAVVAIEPEDAGTGFRETVGAADRGRVPPRVSVPASAVRIRLPPLRVVPPVTVSVPLPVLVRLSLSSRLAMDEVTLVLTDTLLVPALPERTIRGLFGCEALLFQLMVAASLPEMSPSWRRAVGASERPVLNWSVPAFAARFPVSGFAPLRVRVPGPDLARPAVPWMGEEMEAVTAARGEDRRVVPLSVSGPV